MQKLGSIVAVVLLALLIAGGVSAPNTKGLQSEHDEVQ
jgi:hypothetical protein